MSKSFRNLVQKISEITPDFQIERTRKSHIKVTIDGSEEVVFFSNTPSDYRSIRNSLSIIKRIVENKNEQ